MKPSRDRAVFQRTRVMPVATTQRARSHRQGQKVWRRCCWKSWTTIPGTPGPGASRASSADWRRDGHGHRHRGRGRGAVAGPRARPAGVRHRGAGAGLAAADRADRGRGGALGPAPGPGPRLHRRPGDRPVLGRAPAGAGTPVGGGRCSLARACSGSAAVGLDWVLWITGAVLGLGTACSIPYLMMTRHDIGADAAFGGWLMPVAAPMTAAATGALLVPLPAGQARLTLLLACYAMFGISLCWPRCSSSRRSGPAGPAQGGRGGLGADAVDHARPVRPWAPRSAAWARTPPVLPAPYRYGAPPWPACCTASRCGDSPCCGWCWRPRSPCAPPAPGRRAAGLAGGGGEDSVLCPWPSAARRGPGARPGLGDRGRAGRARLVRRQRAVGRPEAQRVGEGLAALAHLLTGVDVEQPDVSSSAPAPAPRRRPGGLARGAGPSSATTRATSWVATGKAGDLRAPRPAAPSRPRAGCRQSSSIAQVRSGSAEAPRPPAGAARRRARPASLAVAGPDVERGAAARVPGRVPGGADVRLDPADPATCGPPRRRRPRPPRGPGPTSPPARGRRPARRRPGAAAGRAARPPAAATPRPRAPRSTGSDGRGHDAWPARPGPEDQPQLEQGRRRRTRGRCCGAAPGAGPGSSVVRSSGSSSLSGLASRTARPARVFRGQRSAPASAAERTARLSTST